MSGTRTYEFESTVWKVDDPGTWFFTTLPFDLSDEIEERHRDSAAGFGSLKVRVRVGATSWTTSLFPSKQAEAYVLPVKKAVREAEQLHDGSPVQVTVEVL
ncbi:DUF1905 domain-containing protein [Aeromicrobium massiliense]|uniref:DUF1905 domain-containing protein n=1 Tax=Aeromicrobium massiliense TaxID=1464554 RepID=UPI0009DB55C8|nr:DUF1905 domain-containing protein [Aeromicrobium massiliense]